MDTVLDLIKKLYPTRNCSLNLSERNISSGKFRVCLEYHIGNCLGPCEARQTEADYNEQLAHIRYLLRGHLGEVKSHLKSLMGEAAEALRFEEAQKYKEKLELLERFQAKSTVVNLNIGNVEVCTLSSHGNQVFVNHLRVSEGVIISSKNMEYRRKLEEPDSEILLLALAEADNGTAYKQREIISSFIPEEWNDPALNFSVPKTGDKKKLLELSMRNTLLFKKEKLAQYEKLDPGLRVERLMNQMQQDLRLKDPPLHIECFDNSNLQGAHAVSACVVFREGKPAKSDYRHFNVRSVSGPNDFDTMKEVITRRYSRLLEEGLSLPQLVVVDGGKGQLSAAVEALQKLGIYGKMAIVGIAKRLEEIYYPNDPVPLYIDKKSETLKVIQHMRDEAHRFGITHHRKRRDKSTLGTELTEIPGIGEETAAILLRSFRSVKRIREATLSDLSHSIGPAKAGTVYRHFHPDEG
jgi:excinuclease ABC subunit C